MKEEIAPGLYQEVFEKFQTSDDSFIQINKVIDSESDVPSYELQIDSSSEDFSAGAMMRRDEWERLRDLCTRVLESGPMLHDGVPAN